MQHISSDFPHSEKAALQLIIFFCLCAEFYGHAKAAEPLTNQIDVGLLMRLHQTQSQLAKQSFKLSKVLKKFHTVKLKLLPLFSAIFCRSTKRLGQQQP